MLIPALTIVASADRSQPLQYAIDELIAFCAASPEIVARVGEDGEGVLVLAGRAQAERRAAEHCKNVDWSALGDQGYVLHAINDKKQPTIIAAGATDAGTRNAIYALMCRLNVANSPPTIDENCYIGTTPTFPLRGMYAHQHWAYNHPYSLRTWTIDEWKQYVDMLAMMGYNLFQIWSMAGILPMPLSEGDEAFLRRYPPVIDHAKQNHGMEVYIGECANNVCENPDVPPIADRLYFDVEALKDPSDPKQMAELRAARAEFYKICNNADGYWVLDSDPGKWDGSPASEFVDILMMNRELINEHTLLGDKAKLVYWMWIGWGTKEREDNWRDTVDELIRRSPEPWWMTVAWEGHWKVAAERKLANRTIYYPYGAIEPEPSMPFTTVVPQVIHDVLDITEWADEVRGIMGNAQTPVWQLPNMYYFARASWDLSRRNDPREDAVAELARLIYPEHAELLTKCWLSVGSPDAPDAAKLADELQTIVERGELGRPGPVGWKLFPTFDQVARDLAIQLRIHGLAMNFCKMAADENVSEDALLEQLKAYCLWTLRWRKINGFRRYASNGYNFFPLRRAAHNHWWRGDHLDKRIYDAIKQTMEAEYEPWEAELVLYPLNH